MWHTLHYSLKHIVNTLTSLARGTQNVLTLAAYEFHNLVFHLIGHCARHVYLVEYGNNLQVVLYSHIEIGDGLSLHSLCGVYYKQRTFTCGNASRHLVGEVYVSRSINKIQNICLAIMLVFHLYGMALDSNATLTLQIHVVKHLALSYLDCLCTLQQSVGKC